MMVKGFPFRLTACLFLVLCSISLVTCHLYQTLRNLQADVELHGGVRRKIRAENTGRRTKAIGQAAKGNVAVRKLLEGTEKVKTTSKNFRTYRKDGDYETALADFNSVEPVIYKANKSYLNLRGPDYKHYPLVGTVGDTRLILRKNGDYYSRGSPVLEIRRALDPLHDRIVYKNPGN